MLETSLPTRLRAAVRDAMKARDTVALTALRSALAAIENAEAVDADSVPADPAARLGLPTPGLRATEVARRSLTAAEMTAVVHTEIVDRRSAASGYEATHPDRAAGLRAEAAVLTRFVGEPTATPPVG